MNYLYGDSTPSPLTSNVLDFLRDAVEFSVSALAADDRIAHGKARVQTLDLECEAELGRMERFVEVVDRAIDSGEKGAEDSPTAHCAKRLKELVADTHRASIAALRNNLAAQRARIDAEEKATRAECAQALATLLAPHDPPDGKSVTKIVLGASGYEAACEGTAEFGLAWASELATPEHWSIPIRVERLVQYLEITTPHVSGWLSKEVKVKPQRIETHVISAVTLDRKRTSFKLRAEIGQETGFDVDVSEATVKIARVGSSDDPSIGSFELPAEEVPKMIDLAARIRASLVFKTGSLLRATTGEEEFQSLPLFAPFVAGLIAMLSPIIREIAQHSLSPTELVIRRLLGDDRREELFISKSSIVEKYTGLAEPHRGMFSMLGLEEDIALAPKKEPPAPAKPAPIKAVVPPSKPPPKKEEPKKEEPKPVAALPSKTPTLRPAPTPAAAPVTAPPVKTSQKPPPPPLPRAVALSESDLTEEETKD